MRWLMHPSRVALALLVRRNFYLGAALAALLTSLAIGLVSRRGRVSADLASGVLFGGAFALGIVLISRPATIRSTSSRSFLATCWGSGRLSPDHWWPSLLVVVTVALLYRPLLFAAFDPAMARSGRAFRPACSTTSWWA